MGNSQSNNARKSRVNSALRLQPKEQLKATSHTSQNLPFLQIDPNPNLVRAQAVRRRHSSLATPSSSTTRPLRHQRSTSAILFSRLGKFGCNSATVSVLSRESESDSPDLFDVPHVENDKARAMYLSQYSDEPPTSPSPTTFSKNSQLTPPPLLPCSPPFHLAYYTPTNADGRQIPGDSAVEAAYDVFLKQFPQYRLTWILDTLRRTDYTRLSRNSSQHEVETYVDYMGGSLYPESLIRVHTEFLANNVLGNTHSISASSQLSLKHAEEARRAVLEFFDASPNSDLDNDSDEYTVIFTPNASGALKLVGEAYQFSKSTLTSVISLILETYSTSTDSTFILSTDSHNSVNGIREFARRGGANVVYVPAGGQKGKEGAFDLKEGRRILRRNKPPQGTSSLLALTGLSNITNAKCPALYSPSTSSSSSAEDGSIVTYARSLGYHTLLDAAALAPTSRISLAHLPVDALAVSFYKMFGFPTGVGALVIRKGFLRQLKRGRPWFAGGTVDVVQVPGKVRTMKGVGEEFEGFEEAGETLPLAFIAHSAAHEGISLRTGCMCNPGGAAALLGIQESMKDVEEGGMMRDGMTLREFEEEVERERKRRGMLHSANVSQRVSEEQRGRTELGLVRISLGLGSDWSDIWRILQWAKRIGDSVERKEMWQRWLGQQAEPVDEWEEVEGGAIRRRGVISCVPCKGNEEDATCVQRISLVEAWDTTIGRAI
ncbi:hypothetical protein HHX47_DHR3000896 [Lentinula edodes]|nr:hypothetical protein HHX47_DHR3000896 [Lentinula edodes]